MVIFSVIWQTHLQRAIPPDRLSRVSAYNMFGSFCLLPLGYILAAPMGTLFGRDGALWIAAGFTIFSTLAVLLVPGVRRAKAVAMASVAAE
jgi:hypothetical protein